jgi:hypothetical protein
MCDLLWRNVPIQQDVSHLGSCSIVALGKHFDVKKKKMRLCCLAGKQNRDFVRNL